jgi:hypothetical protein
MMGYPPRPEIMNLPHIPEYKSNSPLIYYQYPQQPTNFYPPYAPEMQKMNLNREKLENKDIVKQKEKKKEKSKKQRKNSD